MKQRPLWFIFGLSVWAGLLVGLPSVQADVSVASIFGNGMVLQQGQPVPIWGTAAPGEKVTVAFAGQHVTTAADAQGKWKAVLTAMPANATAHELTVTGAGSPSMFKDVLVGEVWLCSGQSNMVLPVKYCRDASNEIAAANYPLIRAFTVAAAPSTNQGYLIAPDDGNRRYALTPQDKCLGTWQACTPQTVPNWSGCAYFFARQLQQRLHVPVGIIIAAYGDTAIEGWISVAGLKAVPAYRERAVAYEEVAQAYVADTNRLASILESQKARYLERSKAWYANLGANDPGLIEKWMTPTLDLAQWKPVTLPVSVADNPLGTPVASIWFRKEVTIPSDWLGKELELHLGVVDSVDEAYVNGVRVGRTWFDVTNYWTVSRIDPVPANAVTSNRVAVALRLLKVIYPMGLFGPAAEMKLVLKDAPDATPVSLAGDWLMRKSQDIDTTTQPQLAPLGNKEPGNRYGHPGVQYNGQIHPLIPYAIRGVIWYQGESNAGQPSDYRSLLPGLIQSWRQEWGQGDFAFGIVLLADRGLQQTTPVERAGFPLLRDAQSAALSVTNTFLANAVGVGEANNIHPKNKQEVGRRLALGALATAYRKTDLLGSSPQFKSMTVEGSTIRLHFDFARGLHAQGEPPVGFAIAGENRTFYFAKAKIDGESVALWSDKVPNPVAVRYAWAANPICNLYNSEDLPLLPFRTDHWDPSQLVFVDDPLTLPSGWLPK